MGESDGFRSGSGPLASSPSDVLELVVDQPSPGVRIVRVGGELDLATCDQLVRCAEAQVAARPWRLVLDLGGVAFLDARGIRTLLTIKSRGTSCGVPVHLVGRANTPVVRPLGLVGLLQHLDPHRSAAELLDTLRV